MTSFVTKVSVTSDRYTSIGPFRLNEREPVFTAELVSQLRNIICMSPLMTIGSRFGESHFTLAGMK